MAKEAERSELHKTIWRIANDLRGSVDGWDFKAYVLGMLFYRFISENLTAYINAAEREAGDPGFDYTTLSHEQAERGREDLVAEKGFFILPGELFANVRAKSRDNEDLNETLARVFTNIEASSVGTASEGDFKGLFADLDVNSPKLGPTVAKRNDKLVKLLDAIGSLPLGGEFTDNTNDLFGDAYEYLMGMYASTAGKSGGEYYTPQEVSELLAKIAVAGKTEVNKVYDPACGSGSLLLKFAKLLGHDRVRQGFYGQEINLTTYNLARINMFLHDVPYEKFDIAHGDTLTDPAHWDDEPFEAIVSNPPYSTRWAGDSDVTLINDERYAPAGVLAPKSRADLAFVMHILHWLSVDGTAAVVEFPGVLYRGGAEKKIRDYLVANNFVDAVIQLPPDLFFGTTIATCIIVLKKSKATNDIAFIDATAEFTRQGNKNKLTPDHQDRILGALATRADAEHFAKIVANDDVLANDSKLSVTSWVEGVDTREVVDIVELNEQLVQIVKRQTLLRDQIDSIVAKLGGGQPDHQRNDPLDFTDREDVSWVPMGEVGEFFRGRRFTKADYVEQGIPAIHYGEIYTRYGTYTTQAFTQVRSELSGSLRFARRGDVVIAAVGETVEDVGKAVAWLGDTDVAIHDDCFAYRHEMDPKFVAYYFQTERFHDELAKHVARAKVKRISGRGLEAVTIPVVPMEEQRRIVSILDAFDALVNDLSCGLPAEIAARRRQYSHYRDLLMTFPAKMA